jgi:hypothetical protein
VSLYRLLGLLSLLGSVVLLAPSPAALAHGDERLLDGSFTIGPGDVIAVDGSIHYHRLVASFAADGPISLTLVDLTADAVVLAIPPAESVTVNHLVACCDSAAWAAHRLLIENPGSASVTGTGRASLVHDDVAVMVHRAESGAAESVGVMGAIWIAVLWRTRRRTGGNSARNAVVTFGVLAAAVLVLAFYGFTRYGVGGIPALIGALSDVPVIPTNPIVSRSSLLLGVAMVGWSITAVRWTRAEATMSRLGWLGLGTLVTGAVGLVGLLAAATYGAAGMPIALTVAALLPLLLAAGGVLDPHSPTARPDPVAT